MYRTLTQLEWNALAEAEAPLYTRDTGLYPVTGVRDRADSESLACMWDDAMAGVEMFVDDEATQVKLVAGRVARAQYLLMLGNVEPVEETALEDAMVSRVESPETTMVWVDADERYLAVWNGDTMVVQLDWKDECFGPVDDEPDYAELAMDMADAVLEALRAGGMDAHVTDVNRAVFTAVSPGPGYDRKDVTFEVTVK